MDLRECLAVSHNIAPEKEICFTDKGAQQWDHVTESTGHPRAACLEEW